MNNIVLYFIKSAIAMALFFGVYRIFLEKETNYSLNRFYLIGTILLSVLLPILPLEKIFTLQQNLSMPVFIIPGEVAASSLGVGDGSGHGLQINGIILARYIYTLGLGFFIMTLCYQFARLMFLRRAGKMHYRDLRVFFVHKDILPFSILNMVFVNQEIRKNPKLDTILDHEYAHYRKLHFVDLLVFEIVTIFQWFNPLVWLYLKSLKEIHEYQADAAVLRGGEGAGNYQALLVNQLTGTEVFRLSNSFSKSLTKKRMIMMTKIKSKNGAWLKVLAATPILAILLTAFSANSNPAGNQQGSSVVSGKVVEAGSGVPMPGVSIIWEGTTSGTVSDMNGNFILKVSDKNAVIVYSFVGFESVKTKAKKDILVRLNRKTYEITEGYDESKVKKVDENIDSGDNTDLDLKGEKTGEIFYIVEDMPSFQGMDFKTGTNKFIHDNLKYPDLAKEKGIQGKVYIDFVVGADGKVSDIKVVRGIDPILDKAAIDLLKSMPSWEPGTQRGKKVAVQFTVPVEYKL